MLPKAKTWDALQADFRWEIPAHYNIGADVSDKWAGTRRTALILTDDAGEETRRVSFAELSVMSNRLADILVRMGVARGDRIGILLPQALETAVSHVAAYKMGAVAVPLFTLFGGDALAYRLENSGARALVTDLENLPKIEEIRNRLPELETILVTDGEGALAPDAERRGIRPFWPTLARGYERFGAAPTTPNDPALIIYTSGTTGQPKGALHGHRVLLGHLPGVEMPHRLFPKRGDLFWTPADWAWIGGLIDVLLPALHHGVPVVAHRMRKFDPQRAVDMMAKLKVRNAFLPPTALKLMRAADAHNPELKLRSVGSGGEPLGEELVAWAKDRLGVTINEFYGQTECNLVVANNADLFPPKPGSMGKPVPGHRVAVIDTEGNELPPGEVGEIAVRRPDPVIFLGYWHNNAANTEKLRGPWWLTGDTGTVDEDGYFWFRGRADDVITSAGYRIGPAEIEECLMTHPAVAMAAAIGVPDPERTERIRAYIVLREGTHASDGLADEIRNHVRTRLAAHEYPREIRFVAELPMTATGKIMRRTLREAARNET
ncbi:acyl-CoA synthetase [Futiania mangrovi]|uniref:Acyl-CoA synthetase n=1 Tax=Futiania mangrovi TaxID=2959716 RepID=A0A9J6PD53_9PROT|nr:acyl-CoA synthetase [Futiania mangrovii]MCP1336254.1 acyl-CoA synthetase [Futiania mangrovii]